MIASAGDLFAFLLEPLQRAPWTDVRGFWLGSVLADRFVIIFAIPLAFLFRALPAARLRPVFVATGLAFVAYVFGVFYALVYLCLCVAMYRFGAWFHRESLRTDVIRWGAPLFAWVLIGGVLLASFNAWAIPVPDAWERFVFERLPWLLPYGFRGISWEPDWPRILMLPTGTPVPFLVALFNPHNIGSAYLAIRMLQYLSEIRRGTIPSEERSLGAFLAWVLYAPNLMQGPIERYADFHAKVAVCSQDRSASDFLVGFLRIAIALLKSVVATLYFLPFLVSHHLLDGGFYKHPENETSTAALYFGVYVHMLWLYLLFSGYCDIAVGIGRMFGYRQVENFHWPWISTSLRDFWRRWHISLSFIARDYIYFPLGGSRRHATLNLCLTFAFIGIWHGPYPHVLTWGVLMGVLVSLNQAWVRFAKRLDEGELGPLAAVRRAWLRLWPLPQLCAWALTIHCVMQSMLAFFGGGAVWRVTLELAKRLWSWIG